MWNGVVQFTDQIDISSIGIQWKLVLWSLQWQQLNNHKYRNDMMIIDAWHDKQVHLIIVQDKIGDDNFSGVARTQF